MEFSKIRCRCCGNNIPITNGVTSYWLQGNKYVYLICYECWAKPYLKALFLHQKSDLTPNLMKEFGKRFGYTKKEIITI